MNDDLIHPSFEDVCQRQAQWIEELEGKATMQCVANGELRAEIAGLAVEVEGLRDRLRWRDTREEPVPQAGYHYMTTVGGASYWLPMPAPPWEPMPLPPQQEMGKVMTGGHREGLMTEAEAYAHIESLSSGPNGGWTRAALAELGIKWPPRKGWKIAVVRRLTGGKLPEDVSDDADEGQGVLQGFEGQPS